MRNSKDVRDLLKERGVDYGNTWWVTSLVMGVIVNRTAVEYTIQYVYWHPLMMIITKLCRTLASPKNAEHWRDIQGYAQLVLDDLGDEDDLPSE